MNSKVLKSLLVLTLVSLTISIDASRFAPPLEGGWHLHNTATQCQLIQIIPHYGEVHFLRLPGRPLALRLVGKRELFAPGEVRISQVQQQWSNPKSVKTDVGIEHRRGRVLQVADPDATALLMQLYQGTGFQFEQSGWFNEREPVQVQVSSVNFRVHYQEFVACFEGLMPAAFADVEKSSLAFFEDDKALLRATVRRLKLLAAYIEADASVSGVVIDGHTDNLGSERYNYTLSKSRAEMVENYLVGQGVPEGLFTVRYHGERYPVSDNKSVSGRKLNRRVTVRLKRDRERVAVR